MNEADNMASEYCVTNRNKVSTKNEVSCDGCCRASNGQPLSVRLYVIKNGYTHNFFKITYSKFFFSNLNSSLANENVDQDFSYIEDEDDRKKCLDLFKSGDLKFDQRSKTLFST